MAFFARTLFSRRRRRRAGLFLSSSAAALVVDQGPRSAGAALEKDVHGRTVPLKSIESAAAPLAELTSTLEAHSADTVVVLGPEFYSLLLVEQPNVAWAEVKDAVRWRIQELLDFPVEQALIDVFPLPETANRGRAPMAFVVAAERTRIKRALDLVSGAGLSPECVDIAELALRNLAHALYPSPEHAIGLLRITQASGTVNITRGEQLFLSRRISGVPASLDAQSWDRFKDALLLQVQRSIDYYESALSQPSANGLLVAATHAWQSRIVEYLGEMLPLPVRAISPLIADEFHITLHHPSPVRVSAKTLAEDDDQALAGLMPALGGWLRPAPNKAAAA